MRADNFKLIPHIILFKRIFFLFFLIGFCFLCRDIYRFIYFLKYLCICLSVCLSLSTWQIMWAVRSFCYIGDCFKCCLDISVEHLNTFHLWLLIFKNVVDIWVCCCYCCLFVVYFTFFFVWHETCGPHHNNLSKLGTLQASKLNLLKKYGSRQSGTFPYSGNAPHVSRKAKI